MKPIRVFIGYDFVEAAAYHALVQSIIDKTTVPVQITPVKRSMLPFFHRDRDTTQSNEFTYSRFLVPFLCGYKGWAVFMDCDMMLRADLQELWNMRDDDYAVLCVKHHYEPKTPRKFLGAKQFAYPRKNWSSLMLFNNERCEMLTPDYVESATPADLHRMRWVMDEQIGEIPKEWNHLVGEYPDNPDAKLVHWTVGGPWFDEYANAEFAQEWFDMFGRTTHTTQMTDLAMAQTV